MNKDIILKAENISKQYRLGQVGTGTLTHDLNRWWHQVRGKENPYLKIGDTNDRSTKGESDYVWALQDINFEVERGEVLGIIGKNGAGKSTLLKILSKVTAPTTGSIKSRGRIASLLEVGTGFNPELTGRENIFLNGAILGMTKKEITAKLDEIIEFSGCERYIDTPVKRYSSGMTVRLAFAVAAFLEPEILVIDEVLAVGDAEFQKKAIGKMQDISREGGRTVLFVSHNMAAVKSLCTRGVVLENGKVVYSGSIDSSINYYSEIFSQTFINPPKHINYNAKIAILDFCVKNNNDIIKPNTTILLGQKIKIELKILIRDYLDDLSIAIDIINKNGEFMSHLTNEDDGFYMYDLKPNIQKNITIVTSNLLFVPGLYSMNIWFGLSHNESLYEIKNFFSFEIEQSDYSKRTKSLPAHSKVYLPTEWTSV
ncbi:lipopolysaccharide transport system ATP-binding protein [Flavobacterium gillisiae]|uniref:Lipopolysaccharide transport system ATP-binding protein n=1 Tax=Flavobacterium gillisiae TaxID=150146 RepID=A0A1H4EVL2_9FLAO|nr:ABC transporter ATP-binding protein [Flavobacterium gillisiae]SEA88897.1 lipopolysaccharide transport system ATP-binding protein [Flavobacterium gillisiae]